MWHYKSLKKILITVLLTFLCIETKADYMQDLQIMNELAAFSEYGVKTNWSVSELNYLENKVNQFSDQSLKQAWILNTILYSLVGDGFSTQTSTERCRIAKRNISKLNDKDLKSIWNSNYNIYGC